MANTFFKYTSDVDKQDQSHLHHEKRLLTQKNSRFLSDHALSLAHMQNKSSRLHQDMLGSAGRRTIVDLGGHGDCGFRAIAAGIMDNVLSNKAMLANKRLMTVLFEAYDHYFSVHSSQPKEPFERLKHIVASPERRYDFVIHLAYVLRQIAVDEMIDDPGNYPGAFIEDHEGTSPEMMRNPVTWIDESAIAALSNALNVPIQVYVVEPNKELANRVVYLPETKPKDKDQLDSVVIQLLAGHYKAAVKHPELYKVSEGRPVFSPIVVSSVQPHDPPMSEILEKVKVHSEAMIANYESHYDELTTLFINNKLNKDQLLSIYIQGMKGSDYLQGFSRHLELHRIYFENALNEAKTGIVVNQSNETQEEFVVERLIHAIARAIAIGHLDQDVVLNLQDHAPSISAVI